MQQKIVHIENILQFSLGAARIFYWAQQGYVSVKLPDVPSDQLNPYQGTRLKVWIKTTVNLLYYQFFNDREK